MVRNLTRAEILDTLLKNYRVYYNITMSEKEQEPLVARCDYFERNEKYILSRKANLWSTEGEEFLYLYEVPHLTREIYEQCMNQAYEDGMTRLNIGPGHMCSYITAVIVCDSCDSEAAAALKKSRIHKSFQFSLRGWMDYRAVAIQVGDGSLVANSAGRSAVKYLKKVLYSKTKKGEN
jgi:hypothetical protein